MKRCLYCHAEFNKFEWTCPECGFIPHVREGYFCFAPDLALENEGFQAAYFECLFTLEEHSFWFTSRNKLITWALKKHFPEAKSLIEIGCGTGYVLSGIQNLFPQMNLTGSEIYVYGLDFAAKRLPNVTLLQMDARKMPFSNEFDVIGAFDLLEHIAEDELVLSEMFRSLTPRGGILITVPQHPFLWSNVDKHACHVRRYTAEELKTKVQRAGFKIERITSFVSLLFPLMVVSRLRSKTQKETFNPIGELKINPLLNKCLESILSFERILIKTGISFPFGGSLLLIGRKG